MFTTSRDFIVLSLDRSHAVEERLEDHQATALSIFDHFMCRLNTVPLDDITLLEFARQYTMPKTPRSKLSRRSKCVVIIPRPYCSPDPAGPKYKQYYHPSLMQHKSVRVIDDLLNGLHWCLCCIFAIWKCSTLVGEWHPKAATAQSVWLRGTWHDRGTNSYTCTPVYLYRVAYVDIVILCILLIFTRLPSNYGIPFVSKRRLKRTALVSARSLT